MSVCNNVEGLTRESTEAQSEFVKHDGFSVLLRAMQSDIEKLQIKSAFLMSALCQQQPHFKRLYQLCVVIYIVYFAQSAANKKN